MRKKFFRLARFKESMPTDTDNGFNSNELGGGSSSEDTANDDSTDEDEDTLESLRAQLARVSAEKDRYKSSINDLTKRNKDLTAENRKHKSAEQLEREAQEERNKRFAEMEKELRVNRYSKRLVGLGMAETEADTFAETIPEMEDSDEFFNTLAAFITAREKAASETAIQDLLKSRPDINAGNGDADKDSPALALAKASIESRKNTGNNGNILKSYM